MRSAPFTTTFGSCLRLTMRLISPSNFCFMHTRSRCPFPSRGQIGFEGSGRRAGPAERGEGTDLRGELPGEGNVCGSSRRPFRALPGGKSRNNILSPPGGFLPCSVNDRVFHRHRSWPSPARAGPRGHRSGQSQLRPLIAWQNRYRRNVQRRCGAWRGHIRLWAAASSRRPGVSFPQPPNLAAPDREARPSPRPGKAPVLFPASRPLPAPSASPGLASRPLWRGPAWGHRFTSTQVSS